MTDCAAPTPLQARSRADAVAMAVAVQANLAQLQTAAGRRGRTGMPALPSPGTVRAFRETLIDWRALKTYSDEALTLRLHEVWGQFCLFCWLFHGGDPYQPPLFNALSCDTPMRCPAEVGAKLLEIERGLWRLRHEDRLRNQPEFQAAPSFRQEHQAALAMPMMVYGRNIRVCGQDELLACTCEYAGMLAAVRWLTDRRWTWAQPGIMELDAHPEDHPAA